MTEAEETDAPARWQRYGRSAALVLAAYAGGLVLLYAVLEEGPVGYRLALDLFCGAAACLGLLWRRRAPIAVGLILAGVSALVASAGAANMVALYFVARQRSLRIAVAVALADVAAGWVFWLVYPGNSQLSLTLTVNIAIAAAVVAWGALLQSQQALLAAYRERAERAESEKALREERIRIAERTRIAREMHDIVAHQISLVALHAGGLEVAPGQGSEVRDTAALIRSSAVHALDDLRTAIGVLREGEPRSLEQPGLNRLADLVAEAQAAGQKVDLTVEDIDLSGSPGVGRDVYRIVQEGLTNARKHAPGEPIRVSVARVDNEVDVRLVNRCSERASGLPGSGSGLIGLVERVTLAGGTLTHETTATGDFELQARLPWR